MLRRTGPAHGYGLIVALRDRSDGAFDLPEGTVYPALHRLERDGLVESEWDTDAPRRRRVYRLTPAGVAALAAKRREWRTFTRGGRRALVEAEDHLRAAAAEEMARGVPAGNAERQAVTRFGAASRIAGQIRRTHRPVVLGSVVSTGWLLAGLAGLALAATYLVKALEFAVLSRMHPSQVPPCPSVAGGFVVGTDTMATVGTCSDSVSVMQHNAVTGFAVLLIGAGALLIGRLASRWADLPPAPRRFPLLVAALFAAAGLVLFLVNPTTPLGAALSGSQGDLFGVRQSEGLWPNIVASGVTLLISAISLLWYVSRTGRRRSIRSAKRDRPAAA